MNDHLALGHDNASSVTSNWDIPAFAGAGGLRSTMNDMLKFARANLDPAGGRLQRVIQQTHAVRRPADKADMSIGMNWLVRQVNGRDIVWHNGGTGGYRTWLGFDKPRKVAAIVLTNAALGNDDLGLELVAPRAAAQKDDGWAKASPESQGLSPAPFAAIDQDVGAGVYGNIDAIAVVRNGTLVVDHRYTRSYQDISRGRSGPLGCGEGCTDPARMNEFNYLHPRWHPYYEGRDIHTLQSVTKSIAATVIGIARGRGAIASLDRPFLDLLKGVDVSRVDPRLRRATLQDLLTMRSGIEWHESDRPLNETNTTVQLEQSGDWLAFTLSQPMDSDPGTKWAYNSGGSQLMSGIIRSTTGRHIDDYAAEFLFKPLGIRDFHWKKTPTGHPDTEGGLYLSAHDLAKIGQLYLQDGVWDGQRVLPPGWVADATSRHAKTGGPGWDYGLQWWLTSRSGAEIWAGRGFGGQLLIVIPSRNVVAVVHSWNVFGGSARNIFDPLVDAVLTGKV